MARERKTKTVAFCIFLFLVFLVFRFPYQNLRGWLFNKVYRATGVKISAEELSPVFLGWPGAALYNVDLGLPLAGSELNLSAYKVVVRVSPGGLFPPSAAYSLKVKKLKQGGNLYLRFSQDKSSVSTEVESDRLNLEQIRFASISGTFQGLLDLDGSAQIQLSDFAKSTGTFELKIKKLKVPTVSVPMSATYAFSIPSMTINDLSARITMRNGVAEINEFKFGGADTDISGSLTGDVRLGQVAESSAVNLTLKLHISPAYQKNPQAVTLVSFLKTYLDERSGNYGLRCMANWQEITTQYKCAIPEKVSVD